MSPAQSSLLKVSKIARLSHMSTTFAEKLERLGKSIPKANKTRWNSQFNTVEKLLGISSTELNDILININKTQRPLFTYERLSNIEWIYIVVSFICWSNNNNSGRKDTLNIIHCTYPIGNLFWFIEWTIEHSIHVTIVWNLVIFSYFSVWWIVWTIRNWCGQINQTKKFFWTLSRWNIYLCTISWWEIQIRLDWWITITVGEKKVSLWKD